MTIKPKRAGRKDGNPDWAKQVAFDMAFAQKTLLSKGEVVAMFVIHTADGGQIPIATPWPDGEAKHRVFQIVRLICVAHGAVALTHIGEVWMREALPGESGETYGAVRPSESEIRKEAVMVTLTYRDEATGERRTLHDAREIERRANGKPSGLKPIYHGEQGDPGGVLIEILPETMPTPTERAVARQLLEQAGIPSVI